MKKVYLFLLIILLFGCSSVKKIENPISLDYTQEDVAKNEIETIRKLKSSDPTKALWRSYLLGNKDILQECIDHCLIQLDLSIEEKDYFEAKKYVISLESVDVKVEKDKKNLIESFYATDIPGFGKNSLEPKTIEDCVNATVTILVDKGLAIKNGIGFADGVVGSGFFIDERGYIITNYHVIKDSDSINVINTSGKEDVAKILGYDEMMDIAVLGVNKDYVTLLAPISFNNVLNIGDTVFTIGSPSGIEYIGTVTKGIISGVNREIKIYNGSNEYIMNVIQTDAAINPGNSGGPLLNSKGEVIGVISLKLVQTEVENMGFAIPIETAIEKAEQIINGESSEYPYMGISMLNVTDVYHYPQYYRYLNSNEINTGVMVVDVQDNSSAASAKLQTGDVIVKINGKEISNVAYLRYELYKYNVGDKIEVTYIRDGKEKSVSMKLTSKLQIS